MVLGGSFNGRQRWVWVDFPILNHHAGFRTGKVVNSLYLGTLVGQDFWDFSIGIPGIVELGPYRRNGIPKDGILDIGCWGFRS